MELTLIPIGYGNVVVAQRIVAVIAPDSSPVKRLREEALQAGKLVDATQGRRVRALLITDSDHVILSALQPETITLRFGGEPAAEPGPETKPRRRKAAHTPVAEHAPEPAGASRGDVKRAVRTKPRAAGAPA